MLFWLWAAIIRCGMSFGFGSKQFGLGITEGRVEVSWVFKVMHADWMPLYAHVANHVSFERLFPRGEIGVSDPLDSGSFAVPAYFGLLLWGIVVGVWTVAANWNRIAEQGGSSNGG